MNVLLAQSDAWFHDLSPFLWRISGDFGIRWYGVSYLLAFVLAYLMLRWLSGRGTTPIPKDRIADSMMLLIGGVVVGGRLGYVILYDPALLIEFTSSAPWWGVLRLSNGGMASHGGFAGVIIAAWLISRGFKDEQGNRVGRCPPLHVMDMCALAAPLGLMLGRLANFINGELLGRVVAGPGENGPWWSVRYPQEILEREGDLSPQQLDAVSQMASEQMLPDEVYWQDGFARMLDQIQHGNTQLQAQLKPFISARYPTQLMQAFFDGLLVFIVVWLIARTPRKPGVVGAWMLIVYALGRIPMDLVRLPDAGVSQFGGLTRGQGYSILMLIAGIAVLVWVHRSKVAPMGGWARSAQSLPLAAEPSDADRDPESKHNDPE